MSTDRGRGSITLRSSTAQDTGRLQVAAWWAATLLTLVVLDDLTFGPAFWILARWSDIWVAVLAVYSIYVPVQLYLVRRATEPEPGRIAAFFLRRFDLERRSGRIGANEVALRGKVIGAGSALAMTVVIGGVLPPLILWRQGASRSFVRRLSIATSLLYATVFAALHAVLPGSI